MVEITIAAIIDTLPILIAMFLGLLVSLVFPYIRKLDAGEIDKFEWKYLIHLVITATWEFIIGIGLYVSWNPPEDITAVLAVLILAFSFGYGGSTAQKEVEKIITAIVYR